MEWLRSKGVENSILYHGQVQQKRTSEMAFCRIHFVVHEFQEENANKMKQILLEQQFTRTVFRIFHAQIFKYESIYLGKGCWMSD